jgi:hypothetical protein
MPDVIVKETIAGVASNADQILNTAVTYLQTNKKKGAAK